MNSKSQAFQSVKTREEKILNDFESLSSWEDRYAKIIASGKKLPVMPEEYRTEENKVRGCQSQVWMFAKLEDGKVHFFTDSDALIVKGLIGILMELYQDLSPSEILSVDLGIFQKIGLEANLSPNRAGGFQAMIKQIKMYAVAFVYKMNS